MLKLKLRYFDHLMRRTDSQEKTLMLGKVEDRRRRGRQRMTSLGGINDLIFAFLFLGDSLDHCLLYNVMNLHPWFFRHYLSDLIP